MSETAGSMEKITARIISDARAWAAQTLSDAHARAIDIREQSNANIALARDAAIAKANEDARQAHERALRMAELAEKQEDLRLKHEILGKVFEEALDGLGKLPDDQYRDLIYNIVISTAEGGEEVIFGADCLNETFFSKLNEAVKAKGLAPLTLSPDRKAKIGGLILRRGGMEVACTFSAVLSLMRGDMETALAAILFSENGSAALKNTASGKGE